MHVGVVGINHKLADLKLRESLAKACQRRFSVDRGFHINHHFVLLSTCNRTEIYFTSSDLALCHGYLLQTLRLELEDEFDQKLYSFFGSDCFLHLTRVTAGLDSAIVGETEIQGQVKAAYEFSKTHTPLPFDLHFLFQNALKLGKWVRQHLQIDRDMPDLEHAILKIGLHFFKRLDECRILFVGMSDINQKILRFFKERGLSTISICNRTQMVAEEVAQNYKGMQILPWSELNTWPTYDWVICATKSPEYLIKREHLPQTQQKKCLLFDLCVPRNIDPVLGGNVCTLMNIDQINRTLLMRKQRLVHLIEKAETMLEEATKRHTTIYLAKEKARVEYHGALC